jgi:putative flippase GtrA
VAPSGAPREYLLFVAAGAVATTAHFALMTLLVEAASAPPVPASCAGALVGARVSDVL